MRRRAVTSILCLVFLGASLQAVAAHRTYVSARGRDRNPCTRFRPCRTFDGALAKTDPGGEIVALNSGSYGFIHSVAQSVSIVAAPGADAAIVVDSGHAITVNAGPDDVIEIKGLRITAQSGAPPRTNGIVFNGGKALYIENCLIAGFPTKGILSLSRGRLHVENSTVRGSIVGVSLDSSTRASLNRVRLEGNEFGLVSSLGASATIRDSIATGNTSAALLASALSGTTAELNIENCLTTHNNVGIEAAGYDGATAIVRVSGSAATDNDIGLSQTGSGLLLSRGNNTVEGNGTDVSGTLSTFTPR